MKKYYFKIFIIISFHFLFSQRNLSIHDIKVEGLQRLYKDDIMRISNLKPGLELIKGDEIKKGIQKLWDLGRFSDIQIYIEEETDDGLIIKIFVKELPVVNNINFIGNKKIKDRTLSDIIKLIKGQIFSENDIIRAKGFIIDKYKEDHYHNISVNTEVEELDEAHLQNINFYISEGKKIRLREVNINGVNNFKLKNIFKKLKKTKPKRWYAFWRGKFNINNFEEDLNILESFYKNEGYRDFSILNKDIIYSEKSIKVNIDIYEGEKYYYRDFYFTGNEKFTSEELLDILNIKSGDIYNRDQLDFSIYENLTSVYMDEGHFYFSIEKEEYPNIAKDSIDIKFLIEENQKVKIRKVVINGNDKTEENVIRRELKVLPGYYFNRGNIIESLKSLYMLNYFGTVEPQILPVSNSEVEVDVSFDLIEKETGRANFSMGYNEVNGFSGGGGFEFTNFLGKGLRLAIDYQKGLQNQINSGFGGSTSSSQRNADYESYSISFTEPRIFDSKNSIGFSLYKSEQGAQQGWSEYDTEVIGGSLTFGRQFRWPDFYTFGSWSLGVKSAKYFGSENQLINCSDPYSIYYPCDFPEDLVKQDGNTYYAQRDGIKLTQTIGRNNVDNAEFATNGSKISLVSTFSGGGLGGNENFHKHVFNFKWYTPITEKIVFFQNYTFGGIKPLVENEYISSRVRFSMGGSGVPRGEMLRGYLDNSIGPPISYYSRGGNLMFKYSIELRFLISPSPTIYFLLFADTGNIWKDFNKVDIFDLKRSVGLGIRLNMPMLGVIGYDIGYGFDHHDDTINKPWGWEQHLIFGVPLN